MPFTTFYNTIFDKIKKNYFKDTFMQILSDYIQNINRLYQTGNAREHSYRGDLQHLLNVIIN